MDEETRKYLAFLSGMIFKLVIGQNLDFNEMQSLDNILTELDYWNLDEKELRL